MTSFSLTDARLYAILDTGYVPHQHWIETYRALVAGGADIIQLRAKTETKSERMALLDAVLPDYIASGVPLIINDDLRLAVRYPGMSVGLHLGQDDDSPRKAREQLGSDALIGLSTHSLPQAQQALALEDHLSYFAVGPVYATPTKPDYQPVGLNLIRQVAEMQPNLPWFCIGGINRQTIGQVVDAGAQRVVVVSDLLQADDPAAACAEIKAALPALRSRVTEIG